MDWVITMDRPIVFLGCSSEGLEDARSIEYLLKDAAQIVMWNHGQDIFSLSLGTLEALMDSLDQFDFAILVLTPDDLILSRNVANRAPRYNVIFELGLFMGRLGRKRTFIVCNEDVQKGLPSDLLGITVATYKAGPSASRLSDLSPASFLIRESIRTLGFKIAYKNLHGKMQRISIHSSTTDEIQKSKEKTEALKLFYKSLITEIERTPFGINTCGPEPLRDVLIDYYCSKLRTHSKAQMDEINSRVRWYWRKGASIGINFEPALFENYEANNTSERRIMELTHSDIIIALAGRTGTRSNIEQIIEFHIQKKHNIDLEQKPLILLAWVGGSIKEYLDENKEKVLFLIQKYPELNPTEMIPDWYKGDKPTLLARRIVSYFQKILIPKC